MSPVILWSAIAIGLAGKLLFARHTGLVILVAVATFPLCAAIYWGEVSFFAALILSLPITLIGALAGIFVAVFLREFWTSRRSDA